MASLATTVETYVSFVGSLRQRTSIPNKLPALHLRSVTPPESPSEVSDLTFPSHTHTLASLRHHVLTYLSDLESHLASLEPSLFAEEAKAKGELKVEEAKAWLRTGLDMLKRIRADVLSHLPESHSLNDGDHSLRSLVQATANLESDSHVRVKFVPTLSEHLHSLQAHLSSHELPHSLAESFTFMKPHATVHELIDLALAPKFPVSGDTSQSDLADAEAQIASALRRSENGAKLIEHHELPTAWQHNPFVTRGYRFIPLDQWPRIVQSLFTVHNETLNIHTHLIPFLFWSLTCLPFSPFATRAATQADLAEVAYTTFSLICLFSSAFWHLMSGCAHPETVSTCAKCDYIGIGWFMCVTFGGVVYYGFRDHVIYQRMWLTYATVAFISCCILPAMDWFNDVKYRHWRISYFTCIGLSIYAPGLQLTYLYGIVPGTMYMMPVIQSSFCYFVGMLFYASHFPESFVNRPGQKHWLDWFGGGSHAIWHTIVVIGIAFHRNGLEGLKRGVVV